VSKGGYAGGLHGEFDRIHLLKVPNDCIGILNPTQAMDVLLSFEPLEEAHDMLCVLMNRKLFSGAVIKDRAEQPFTSGYSGYMACAFSGPLHLQLIWILPQKI
jgi:hypothetical protein